MFSWCRLFYAIRTGWPLSMLLRMLWTASLAEKQALTYLLTLSKPKIRWKELAPLMGPRVNSTMAEAIAANILSVSLTQYLSASQTFVLTVYNGCSHDNLCGTEVRISTFLERVSCCKIVYLMGFRIGPGPLSERSSNLNFQLISLWTQSVFCENQSLLGTILWPDSPNTAWFF